MGYYSLETCAAMAAKNQLSPSSTEDPLFSQLPIDLPDWTQGYGPTAFSRGNGKSNYGFTSGLHGGIDFAAPAGTGVRASIYGTVVNPVAVGLSGDASPNVVVQSGKFFVVFGHTSKSAGITFGANVEPASTIGSLVDQGTNTHLHLAVLTNEGGVWRNHNPIRFFNASSGVRSLDWNDYENSPFTVDSVKAFDYSRSSFRTGYGAPNWAPPSVLNLEWGGGPR